MAYVEVMKKLNDIGNYKAKDAQLIAKEYINNNLDVNDLLPYILDNWALHRIYFEVNLKRLKSQQEQFEFIERHFDYLNDWYHTDELIQFVRKYITFEYAYNKAKYYVRDKRTFVRRWGYVLFLTGIHKEPLRFKKIAKLFHNDNEYYVVMAQAWLLADLCIYAREETIEFIRKCKLNYNILGKAIQKICDSYRIDDRTKEICKGLRERVRDN